MILQIFLWLSLLQNAKMPQWLPLRHLDQTSILFIKKLTDHHLGGLSTYLGARGGT